MTEGYTRTRGRIRVVIADDSPVVRELLCMVLAGDPTIEVVGRAVDGQEVVDCVRSSRPDLVTLDVNMPRMGGLEALRRIMKEMPVPVLIITNRPTHGDDGLVFEALSAGALSVIEKPDDFLGENGENFGRSLISQIHAFAGTMPERVVSRAPMSIPRIDGLKVSSELEILGIGTSAGGPVALARLFRELPRPLKVPVLVVQHITPGFLESFIQWLSAQVGLPIRVGKDGEEVRPGEVYFAPEDVHMEITSSKRLKLCRTEPQNGFRPSTDRLFESLARSFGARSIGVILTGMGDDGARGLLEIRQRGGRTFAQDEESSLVFGMPRHALELGAVDGVQPLDELARDLATLIGPGRSASAKS